VPDLSSSSSTQGSSAESSSSAEMAALVTQDPSLSTSIRVKNALTLFGLFSGKGEKDGKRPRAHAQGRSAGEGGESKGKGSGNNVGPKRPADTSGSIGGSNNAPNRPDDESDPTAGNNGGDSSEPGAGDSSTLAHEPHRGLGIVVPYKFDFLVHTSTERGPIQHQATFKATLSEVSALPVELPSSLPRRPTRPREILNASHITRLQCTI
jgi:hypothetical protein